MAECKLKFLAWFFPYQLSVTCSPTVNVSLKLYQAIRGTGLPIEHINDHFPG